MGTMIGHVGPGFGFMLFGLWHLINNIRLYSKKENRKGFHSLPWFPAASPGGHLRYLELYLIMVGSTISISMELFIGPANHQPLDPSDWTIPSDHLHNFEHASISLTFLLYAALALALDRRRTPASHTITLLLAAVAFSQQLLMFHLHSTDHMGVEGQYHWLLQLVIAVSLSTTVLGIGWPRSFAVSFARSASIFLQGAWLTTMGVMLWTPSLIAKGCFMNDEEGHYVVRCHGDEALHRAKSLVNIQFSWFLAGVAAFSVILYMFMSAAAAAEEAENYLPLVRPPSSDDEGEEEDGMEKRQQKRSTLDGSDSFAQIGKGMQAMDVER